MHGEPRPAVLQEADRIHTRPVVLILIAAVVLAGGLVTWGWLDLRAGERAAYPDGIVPATRERGAPGPAVGIVQTLINVDTSAAADREAAASILRSHGWVDSAQGIVRIPIEQAMRAVAEGSQP
ncbi:MAG TPA: hypothetical protein VNZ57_02640 [Longimicrobiales bacterium]|nr:hypothetical protein [Longimicrobiales bacterium]